MSGLFAENITASATRIRGVIERPANPAGRKKLTIDYVVRAAWPPGDVAFIEKLLIRYFEVFGCFRLIDTRLIGIWVRALRLYSRDELVWALAAKKSAMQPTDTQTAAFKRQFSCAPDRFIDKLDYWLAQGSAGVSPAGAVGISPQGSAGILPADQLRAAWDSLTDEQRQIARNKTFAAFKRACSQTTGSDGRPLDPDHVEADRLQIDIALRYARGQGWLPRRQR